VSATERKGGERPLETCREESPVDWSRCGKPAEFILWGKLLKPESLGPRCYDCAAKHLGAGALSASSGWAVFDLREVDPFFARASSVSGREREAR
jgi:hypothetical protein